MVSTEQTAPAGEVSVLPRSAADPSARRGLLDRVGVVASVTCAVHCALMPLLLAAIPGFGMSFFADERMEWLLFASVLVIGTVSLLPSYLRRHHDARPLALYGAGVAILLGVRLQLVTSAPAETVFAVGGALLVACAHLLNLRRARACAEQHHDHDHADHAH